MAEHGSYHEEDAFSGWMAKVPTAKRGGGGYSSVNEAPPDMEDLRQYFVGLPERRLATCWVAAVADASQREFSLGDIARALIVVAVRLNKVQLPEEVLIVPPIPTHQPRRTPPPEPGSAIPHVHGGPGAPRVIQPAATQLRQELGVRDRPVVQGSIAEPLIKGAGWDIVNTPWIPKGKRGRGPDPELLAAVICLNPLPARIRLDGEKWGSTKANALIKNAIASGGSIELAHLKTADGHRVIYRKGAAQ